MPGIVIKTLTKRYGEVAAVEGLSLDVNPGELVSLLGPSGCGKTTTLRLVAGFLQPEAGEIWVGERCLSSPTSVVPPERRRMAMIFQSYVLWPHMTVAQNVAYGLRFKAGVSRVDRDRRAADMLRTVQLAGFESRYPGELSGGQQQRVAVARALVVEPEILLLDEPLSNLDANLREEMRFEIRRLSRIFRHHDPLRDPRPGGGDGHLRSRRGPAPWTDRAGRDGGGSLSAPADPVRGRVHRQDELDRRRDG